ncbi:MAG: hypothetical protein ABSH41_25390 [Syntrophobacteraceae bacterium]
MLNREVACDCVYFLRVPVLVLRPLIDFEAWMTVILQIVNETLYDISIIHQRMILWLSAQRGIQPST